MPLLTNMVIYMSLLLPSFFRYDPVDVTAHAAFLPAQCDDLYTGLGHVKCDAGAWDLYNASCTPWRGCPPTTEDDVKRFSQSRADAPQYTKGMQYGAGTKKETKKESVLEGVERYRKQRESGEENG